MVWWPRTQMWNWSAWCFNCLISQKCRNCELEDTRWQGKHRYGYGSNAICIWSCWSKEMRYGFWIQFSVSHGCLKTQFTVHCQTKHFSICFHHIHMQALFWKLGPALPAPWATTMPVDETVIHWCGKTIERWMDLHGVLKTENLLFRLGLCTGFHKICQLAIL